MALPKHDPDRRAPARLGVLGGSFNPVHGGHLAMAEAARRAHGLDRVLFVPAGSPPHKSREALAPAGDRLRMVALAVEGRPGFEASDIELSRAGTTYTVETLQALHEIYPGAELYFILGEDSVPDLPGWREPGRILELARVVAVNRPGVQAAFRGEDYPGVPRRLIERMERDRVFMEPCDTSSREVRRAVRDGRPIEGRVPPAVAAYIARHGLYRGT